VVELCGTIAVMAFQRTFAAQVDIDAPPERVWAVLLDLPRYPEWNPLTTAVQSELHLGAPVELTVRMSRLGRTVVQRVEVREVTVPHRLRWGMTMGLPWILRAERIQRLEPLASGRTRYVTEDTIAGALGPVVFGIFGPSLVDGFEAMARALAEEVERRAAAG
jgi:hypothetical protein